MSNTIGWGSQPQKIWDESRCVDSQTYGRQLQLIDGEMQKGISDYSRIRVISQFFQNNKEYLLQNDEAIIRSEASIAKNIKYSASNLPLAWGQIADIINLLPAKDTEEATLASLKEIKDQSLRLETLGKWIKTMNFSCDSLTQEEKSEIALFWAKKDVSTCCHLIRKLKISNTHRIIEIAKVCASRDGNNTARNIRMFKITDEASLIEIAKICALHSGYLPYFMEEGFGIKDQLTLFEIAKLIAQHSSLENYQKKFTDRQNYELLLEGLKGEKNTQWLLESYKDNPWLKPLNVYEIYLNWDQPVQYWNEAMWYRLNIRSLIGMLPCSTENKNIMLDACRDIHKESLEIQKAAVIWWLKFGLLSREQNNIDWMFESGLWKKLFELEDLDLRLQLTAGLVGLNSVKEKIVCKGKYGKPLISISLFELMEVGVDKEKVKGLVSRLNQIRSEVQVKTFLETVHILACDNYFTQADKIAIFEKIFFSDESMMLQNLTAARAFIQLKNTDWMTSALSPNAYFKNIFTEILPLQDFKGDFSALYDETFGSCREPQALITYIVGLKTLNTPEVLTCLSRFVQSVLEGTFLEKRYDTTNTPHLKRISDYRPDLLEIWKTNVQMEFSKDEVEETAFKAWEWVRTKLLVDRGHLKVDLPFLKSMDKEGLKAELMKYNKSEEIKQMQQEVKARTKTKADLKKLTDAVSADPVLNTLKLQLACIALSEAKPEQTMACLEEIKQILHHRTEPSTGFADSEFSHELDSMLESLKKTKDDKNFTVVFTDDPFDLFLCGTEVHDSCQRIGGNPQLNVCLLGYLMDGKNKMIAIKDENGKLVSRCIVRLVDGEEPVFFRERFYPANISEKQKHEINRMARLLTERMKVPLTSLDPGKPYGKPLISHGTPAPFEYCDGTASEEFLGNFHDGPYRIESANILE